MMMTAMAAAVLATAAAEEPAPKPSQAAQQQLASVAIPFEVSPAMMPYLICRQSEAGVALYDSDGKIMNPEGSDQDCDQVRERSMRHTINLLEELNLGRHTGERRAFAEHWLAKIDEMSGPAED